LAWRLKGYPSDEASPGGALIFSLWRNATDGREVMRMRYVAQTPDQMHNATPLTLASPPAMQELRLQGCVEALADGACPLDAFARVVRDKIDPAFVR